MSKKRRVRKSPAGRAAGMASGVTLLTVAFILFAAWPLILPGRRIQATSAGLALAGIVVSGVAWWWAMRVAHEQNAAGKRLEELQALSPDAFEEWVAARFRERGYTVELVGTQGDHGIDLIVTRADIQAVVQCKNYRSWSVGEPVLRDLFGAMHASGANHAFLVTTGRLTAPATVWVRGKPIDVWNGEFLSQLSQGVREAGELAPRINAAPTPASEEASYSNGTLVDSQVGVDNLTCPRCASTLVVCRNRRTGQQFLGCAGFPACRYTRSIMSDSALPHA